MLEQTMTSLEQLAADEPDIAVVALLYRDVIAAFNQPDWQSAQGTFTDFHRSVEHPSIHEQTLEMDLHAVQQLIQQMAVSSGVQDHWPSTEVAISSIDPVALCTAIIEWNVEAIERISLEVDIEPEVLFTLGNCAIIPQFNALSQMLTTESSDESASHSWCPVCGSWPILAEQRGLAKQLWLRCGRCSAGWRTRHLRCIFCGNHDHHTLGYMAAESERESRRVNICEECHSYIKILATVTPLDHGALLKRDLDSLDLDAAATEAGYTRPEQPGYPVSVHLQDIKR